MMTLRKRDSLPWLVVGTALIVVGFPHTWQFLDAFIAHLTPPPHLMARPSDASPDDMKALALRWEIIEGSFVLAAIPFLIQGCSVYLRSPLGFSSDGFLWN